MNLLTYLLVAIVATAVVGYFGRLCARRGVGDAFWGFHRVLASTFLLFFLIAVNFIMATTALERILQKEQYVVRSDRDPIGWVFFGNHSLLVAPLFAAAIVLFSIVAAGHLMRGAKCILRFLTSREQRPTLVQCLTAACWVVFGGAVVAFDALLMGLRLAMMLFPERLDGALENLPAVWLMGNLHTAAGSLLLVALFAYPGIILAAERNFANAWHQYNEDSRATARPIALPDEDAMPPAPRAARQEPRVNRPMPRDPFEDMVRPVPPAHL